MPARSAAPPVGMEEQVPGQRKGKCTLHNAYQKIKFPGRGLNGRAEPRGRKNYGAKRGWLWLSDRLTVRRNPRTSLYLFGLSCTSKCLAKVVKP
jgi:hypothetical protein